MEALRITLFGSFTVEVDETGPVHFKTRKEQELLAYLVLHRQRVHARETLASLLWSEVTTTQSRKYLRRALWRLRTALGERGVPEPEALLCIDSEHLRVSPEATAWIDVCAFEQALDAAEQQPDAAAINGLEAALALYVGDVLDGWYEDWCLYERERLRHRYVHGLQALIAAAERQGDLDRAVARSMDWVYYDTLSERAQRCLMRTRYRAGDRSGALRQYGRCVAMLRDELGVSPSAPTQALHAQILAGQQLDEQEERTMPSRSPAGIVSLLRRIEDDVHRLRAMVLAEAERLEGETEARPPMQPKSPSPY
ncbi:MAG: hypothetical protein HKN04_08800 [Rhodothermaceae bacterium]|nr:hypothetical protein [Rhodothermaceae bacterium]